jgi:DNA-binding MarR family transcriptional regulator
VSQVHGQHELARRMSCEPSNVTYVVDRLSGLGLIERQPHPYDRRARHLVLTERGTQVRDRLLGVLVIDSPLDGLTASEQRLLRDLLLRAVNGPPPASSRSTQTSSRTSAGSTGTRP